MTDAFGTQVALPPSQVEELLTLISKALRAVQLYLPNNPVYQRALENVRGSCRKIWQATDDVVLEVQETELRWEGNLVYSHDQKNESIAWTLFKDGVRSVTLRSGVEETELVRFLQVLHQARTLQAEAADDLLTLLWQEDFQFLTYTFREISIEGGTPIEAEGPSEVAPPAQVRDQVEKEAPQREVVSVDEFDTTLYFLEDQEIGYLQDEVEREYSQDLRHNVLSVLFDLIESQTYATVRGELISIIENFIPYLLGSGDFHSVAFVLRELAGVLQRGKELIPEHKIALTAIPTRLSQPDALSQLLQALDEATMHPTEAELGELFRELQPEALVTLAGWVPRLSNEQVKMLVKRSAERLASQNAGEHGAAARRGKPRDEAGGGRSAHRRRVADRAAVARARGGGRRARRADRRRALSLEPRSSRRIPARRERRQRQQAAPGRSHRKDRVLRGVWGAGRSGRDPRAGADPGPARPPGAA